MDSCSNRFTEWWIHAFICLWIRTVVHSLIRGFAQIDGFMDLWICREVNSWINGFTQWWIHGFIDSHSNGFTEWWRNGFVDSRSSEFIE